MEKARNAVNANRLRQQDLPERCKAVLSRRLTMPDLRGSGTRARTLFRPFPQLSGFMVPWYSIRIGEQSDFRIAESDRRAAASVDKQRRCFHPVFDGISTGSELRRRKEKAGRSVR